MRKIAILLLLIAFQPVFPQTAPDPGLKKPKSGGAPDIYEAPPALDSNGPEASELPEDESPPVEQKSGKSPYENPEHLKEPDDEKNADRGDDTASFWKKGSFQQPLAFSELAATYDPLSTSQGPGFANFQYRQIESYLVRQQRQGKYYIHRCGRFG